MSFAQACQKFREADTALLSFSSYQSLESRKLLQNSIYIVRDKQAEIMRHLSWSSFYKLQKFQWWFLLGIFIAKYPGSKASWLTCFSHTHHLNYPQPFHFLSAVSILHMSAVKLKLPRMVFYSIC